MPAIIGKNGHKVPWGLSLSKRERGFILRLLNQTVSLDMSDDDLISYLSSQKHLLADRKTCTQISLSELSQGVITPTELIYKCIKEECINDTNFSWIDATNDRLCNYAWSFIRSIKQYPVIAAANLDIGISINGTAPDFDYTSPLYIQFHLETSPPNNISKKNCIIAFFDMLNITYQEKVNGVALLKSKWEASSKKMDVKLWVEKCDAEWAWNYLFSNIKSGIKKPPIWFIESDKSSTIKDSIITLFDLLNEMPPTRELILIKMKSAWSQKSYRDKNNDKKSVNVVLPDKIISMLDTICMQDGRRKNEVITRLIKDEYEKISK